MKTFVGYPNKKTLKVLDEAAEAQVFGYTYDDENLRNADIRQIIKIVSIILGSLADVQIIHRPVENEMRFKRSVVFLSIKNRSDIQLGIYKL